MSAKKHTVRHERRAKGEGRKHLQAVPSLRRRGLPEVRLWVDLVIVFALACALAVGVHGDQLHALEKLGALVEAVQGVLADVFHPLFLVLCRSGIHVFCCLLEGLQLANGEGDTGKPVCGVRACVCQYLCEDRNSDIALSREQEVDMARREKANVLHPLLHSFVEEDGKVVRQRTWELNYDCAEMIGGLVNWPHAPPLSPSSKESSSLAPTGLASVSKWAMSLVAPVNVQPL